MPKVLAVMMDEDDLERWGEVQPGLMENLEKPFGEDMLPVSYYVREESCGF